jgi:23S rRNA (cytidine1920-2'-O)/16S rRNA (cytidine1409-2'-O)-methyltransferase
VSRGGLKLAHALRAFSISVRGLTALDAGASTGGFTDVLLQSGARTVYAVDVGYGQLAWTLRTDPRVVVMERTNIRTLESLPEPIDLAVADLSFISLRLVLPAIARLLTTNGEAVVLIKPQFEAGRGQVGRKGVVRDPDVWAEVLRAVLSSAMEGGWRVLGLARSPVRGPAGNVEFLAHLSRDPAAGSIELEPAIGAVICTVT